MSENRDEGGRFAPETPQKFGREGVEAAAGYKPLPETAESEPLPELVESEPTTTDKYGGDHDGLRAAAAELTRARDSERKSDTARAYRESTHNPDDGVEGGPDDWRETVTLDRAARDLADARANEREAAEAKE